jgi:uncharacterized protein (TIGR04255 family)
MIRRCGEESLERVLWQGGAELHPEAQSQGWFSRWFPLGPMGSSMGTMVDAPFGPPVPEVALPRAPLVFVVAQARFERVASVSSESFIGAFQEAIRGVYPVMRLEQQAGVLIGPTGPIAQAESSTAWRFEERPERWQVTLAPDFVSLSTTRYTRRRDLIDRLRDVVSAAQEHLQLRFCDRLGARYIDRLTDEGLLGRLPELVRPEVLGTTGVDPGEDGVQQAHTFSDSTYRMPENAELHARWGLLPPQATFDPSVAPADARSWVLDLDAYTGQQEVFDPAALTARAEALCERVYRFFRWAVTDEFLAAHGGQP